MVGRGIDINSDLTTLATNVTFSRDIGRAVKGVVVERVGIIGEEVMCCDMNIVV